MGQIVADKNITHARIGFLEIAEGMLDQAEKALLGAALVSGQSYGKENEWEADIWEIRKKIKQYHAELAARWKEELRK